ncbi:putative RNA-directed DNA polymerase from transposon BS [Folsomia candida]|uniref:Putative RNA-directed DNA polymerase from transposon BS n=1 Tax=Folsomia candida TaxID=158441 RepID=A0A226EBC7_FOLCA|nr:putative RNA-directed DNA polymerase from transposon BS [Folsomia candida]
MFVTSALNIYAPLKNIRVKHFRKKWLNAEYEQIHNLCKKLKKNAVKTGSENDWADFRKCRNKTNNIKCRLKANVIKSFVAESDNQSKTCWKLFNEEVGRTKRDSTLPNLFVNGQEICDEKEKLNILCQAFIRPELFATHPFKFEKPLSTMCHIILTPEDIQKAIQELDTNKPTGIDGIPPIFYKICADSLVPILTLLFNEFLSTGEYPEELKQAAVFPLYKGNGKRCDPICYRPISILCTTTKLFESCIYHRIMPFMEKEDKLNHQQHGYRPYRSTQSAILKLTNEIRNTGDAREISGAIFVDFSSAFDNIIHGRLLQKMESLGITGELNKWFAAYFTNRTMLVRRGKMKSAVHKLLRGTCQGSSLSGLIFDIYVYDIPCCIKECSIYQYADDLVLIATGNTINEINDKLQRDLQNLQDWCHQNGMEINIKKTQKYTRSDHNKNLRSKNDFVLPKAKTKFGQMSFMYQSIKMWNALPYEMKDSELFSQFYPKLREYKIKARV